jgi:carbonic anhydrase
MAERRLEVAKGQHPFAVILGRADSRVPPEIIFDHTLGDLFVVRVAGNIVHDPGIGSIEYAVTHFGVPLLMVLGHARCGAVEAAPPRR